MSSAKSGTSLSPEKETKTSASAFAKKSTSTIKKTEATTEASVNIQENPFYKIMAQKELSPEQKRDAIASELAFDKELSKKENRAKLEAFAEFKEYMQEQRTALHQRSMALNETESFSELQTVIKDMNDALIEFEEQIAPLTDILEAVYELQQAGKTIDVYQEIKSDKEWEKQQEAALKELEGTLSAHDEAIRAKQDEIAALQDEKSFFGLGGTKKSALYKIDQINAEIATIEANVAETTTKIGSVQALLEGGPDSAHPELKKAKETLRMMLDLSAEGHRDRQVSLVNAAQQFVEFSKTRTASTLDKFEDMKGQIRRTVDISSDMANGYAILDEAVGIAEKKNLDILGQFKEPQGTAGSVAELQRADTEAAVNEFVTELGGAALDTKNALQELQKERIQNESMLKANSENIRMARTLTTNGVATVASNLSAVLNSVGSAALVQSTSAAQETMSRMTRLTQDIALKEVINTANRSNDANAQLVHAMESLAEYHEIQKAATDIHKEALTAMRGNMDLITDAAKELGGLISDDKSVAAEVLGSHVKGVPDEKKPSKVRGAAPTGLFGGDDQ